MKLVRTFLILLLLGAGLELAGLAVASSPASADETKTIVYNVTTDEAWRAGMALGQANVALDNGYEVVVFLNVRGVFIASTKAIQDIAGVPQKSTQALLTAAMEKGAEVIICPMCMKRAGMTMDEVIDGVVKGGPDVTFKTLTADDTVVLSY